MVTDGKTLAREYLRVSLDKSGRERSQDEQHQDNQRVADEHGWTLGDPYRDTGRRPDSPPTAAPATTGS